MNVQDRTPNPSTTACGCADFLRSTGPTVLKVSPLGLTFDDDLREAVCICNRPRFVALVVRPLLPVGQRAVWVAPLFVHESQITSEIEAHLCR
jgi:hypothetical protein